MLRINSHVPVDRPEVAFVYGSSQAAMATLDRVATVGQYTPTATYPGTPLGLALRAVAGAMNRGVGTKVFYVTIGGFDTHSAQAVNATNGAFYTLMTTINNAFLAFYTDLKNQGLFEDTLLLSFSEFGRRISENNTGAAAGTDHGAASVMMVMGGTGERRGVRHGARAQPGSQEPHAREQRRRRALRDRLPLGVPQASSTAGSAPTRGRSSAATSGNRRSTSSDRGRRP